MVVTTKDASAVKTRKLAKACLTGMPHRVVEGGARAQAAQAKLELGRVDEAMDIAFDIEPLLHEANHMLQSASLLRHDRLSKITDD